MPTCLHKAGHLLAREDFLHAYPKCWRHKSPVIFRAAWQWFVDMDRPFGDAARTLRETARAAIAQTEFFPPWGQNRMDSMVAGRPDWCLSRQRFWNVPMPLFLHKESGEPHPQTAAIIEQAAALVEKGGIEAWFAVSPKDILGDEAASYDKVSIRWMCGLIQERLIGRCWLGKETKKLGRICIWKVPTSTAAGFNLLL